MTRDAQGHTLAGATAAAAEAFDQAVRAFTLNHGDVNGLLDTAGALAPDCAMVSLTRAWILMLGNDPDLLARARAVQDALPASLGDREQAHQAALRLALAGSWPSAVAVLDRHLMHFPHDLVAHQVAMRLDGYLGRFQRTAGRLARALPAWSREQPGHAIALSFYGFGLEESGDYARAEDISREAAELEPYGYWPHHAVSHVLEMTGRPRQGIEWMEGREPLWSGPQASNRVHIWWHKALFHVELGEWDAALALYDGPIMATQRPVGASLCNPTALLWRLQSLGCQGGERWTRQHAAWQGHADGRTSPFNDIHAAIAALGAGEWQAFERLRSAMIESAASGGELSPAYRDVALPAVEALANFERGEYSAAVDRLLPARADLWRMGGSVAQRDLVDWTLAVAALRAGSAAIARSLLNERLALRPDSAVNQHFMAQARALHH